MNRIITLLKPCQIYICAVVFALMTMTSPVLAEQAIETDVIVLLDAEHPTAHFAAREFQRYIYLRTGVLLNIEKPQSTLKINTKKKAKKKTVSLTIDSATFGNDEYRIKAEGDRLSVTGGSSTGLLYRVYRTLEHFGIRFYIHGDVIPDPFFMFTYL